MKGILIELLISMLLISVALASALSTQLISTLQLNTATEQAIATRLLWDATNQFNAQANVTLWMTQWQHQVATDLPQGIGQISQNQLMVKWYNHQTHQQQSMSIPI